MPHNGIVFSRSLLDNPVPSANPHVFSVFDAMASLRLNELARADTITTRVRHLVATRIGRQNIGICDISNQLHMSQATLRRRLEDEDTTYKSLVDDLRRALAAQYILDGRLAMGEIASLLDFSTVSAFGRAFRRWNGICPLEHRIAAAKAPHGG